LAGEAVHDGAAAEEEECFEEGVGEDMVHAAGWGEDAEPGEHVSELGDCGVGHDSFDVELGHGDGGGEQRGDGADPGDDGEGELAGEEEGVGSGDEVDACGDHGGGVDEGRDWGGAFHGVGEPDIEGELCGFTKGADHEEDGNPLGDGGDGFEVAGLGGFDVAQEGWVVEEDSVFEGAEVDEGQVDAECEAKVADAVDDERFFGGGDGFWFFVEVSDEEVGAEPDAFPAEVEHEEVVAHDQAGHGEDE